MRLQGWVVLVAVSSIGACRSTIPTQTAAARYLVTAEPIVVGLSIPLCVAIDPSDPKGVWWWGAGSSGCASRSTGPDLFRGQDATVVQATPDGTMAIGFRLGTHSDARPFIDVRLVATADSMRALESGAQVALRRRADLDIPLRPPYGRVQ